MPAQHKTPRKQLALALPAALITALAFALAACFNNDDPEPAAQPEPMPEVILSSCPDTIATPDGAPFTVSTLWCAQNYLDDLSLEGVRNSAMGTIETIIADFNQSADLTIEDIIMLEITFDNSSVGGTTIPLAGEESELKLVLEDGSVVLPTAWVEVNDPLRDLESVGDGPFSNFLGRLGGSLLQGLSIADELVAMTDPLVVDRDVRVWVPYIFPIANPAAAVDYSGTEIQLNYSPKE